MMGGRARLFNRILRCCPPLLPLLLLNPAFASDSPANRTSIFGDHVWIHGSADCTTNSDPAIEVFAFDESTYVLRQNKCLSYEAPFMFVIVGADRVLVLDTGAVDDPSKSDLYSVVGDILGADKIANTELLVLHTHSHGDHCAGDAQFRGKPNVTLVEPKHAAMTKFFGFSQWPDGEASVDLGDRTLQVIPTPGHQEESITIYDPQTRWLLTGDTVYPGYIYVKHWDAYRDSIARLARFTESREVTAIVGSHIEMTRSPGKHYAIGTTFQPDEAQLDLGVDHLELLNRRIQAADDEEELVFDDLIVARMNFLQRTISNIARWLTQ